MVELQHNMWCWQSESSTHMRQQDVWHMHWTDHTDIELHSRCEQSPFLIFVVALMTHRRHASHMDDVVDVWVVQCDVWRWIHEQHAAVHRRHMWQL